MEKITVIIYTHNEEKNINDCLESAKLLTDRIILIDMESSDKTLEIVKGHKVSVLNFPRSNYVEPAREFGIKQAKTDWVFILDADERMTKELAEEINSVISQIKLKSVISNQSNSDYRLPITDLTDSTDSTDLTDSTYFKIPRKNIFAGVKWLKHGGWWPDHQIRLINKKYFVNWPKRIHSTPVIKGSQGYLKNPLIHYFHGDLSGMVKKTTVFEDIESNLLFHAERSSGTGIFFRKFFAELYRRLLKNLGFLDGPFGIIESIYQAFSKTITYLFLYEKQVKKGRTL